MSKKYAIELKPSEISKLVAEYQTQVFSKNRQWKDLPQHLQEKSFTLIFDTCSLHYQKSSVVTKLKQIFVSSKDLETYKEELFQLIDGVKVEVNSKLSALRRVTDDIVGLVARNIETKEAYHEAVIEIVQNFALQKQIDQTWLDCSNRPGYFEGKRIPKFSQEEFAEKGAEFIKSCSEAIDEDLVRFVLCYNNQAALGSVRFFFLNRFQDTLSSDVRVDFEYDRQHKFDITVCDDGSVKFHFVEHMLSNDQTKGLIATQRFTLKVKKNEKRCDERVANKQFRGIEVSVENLSFEIFDEQYLKLLLSIELPLTIAKISKGGAVSQLDESLFQACANYYSDCNNVSTLNQKLVDGQIDEYGLFVLCWNSHFYRSIILGDLTLRAKLQSLPVKNALFSKLIGRSYHRTVIRALEISSISSPIKKKSIKKNGVRYLRDSRSSIEQEETEEDDGYLSAEKRVKDYRIKIQGFKKPGKLIKACNDSQVGNNPNDPDRLLFKAFIELLQESPNIHMKNFLDMSPEVHAEALSDVKLIAKLLRSDNVQAVCEFKGAADLILQTLKNQYDVYPELANVCIKSFVPFLEKSLRRVLLHDNEWQRIFFKMVSNDLSYLPFIEKLTDNVDRGFWLVLQGGNSTQWRYFMLSLFAVKETLFPKKQPLDAALGKLKKKRKKLTAEISMKANAYKLIGQSAALNKDADIDAAEEKAKGNKERADKLEKKLSTVNEKEEKVEGDLRVLTAQLSAINLFSELMFKEHQRLSSMVLMFEMLGLIYANSDVKLWRQYKEKFNIHESYYEEMRSVLNSKQAAYFLGKNDGFSLSDGLKPLSGLLKDPELLVARMSEDLRSCPSGKLEAYLEGAVGNHAVLAAVFESEHSSKWIEALYIAVEENPNQKNQESKKITLKYFEILTDRVLFSSLTSCESIATIYGKGCLPQYVLDCSTFDILTLFVIVAGSLSDKPHQLPDGYLKRLRNAEDRIQPTLELLEGRFGLGSWVFALFDQWDEPDKKAIEMLKRACRTTKNRTAPSEEMIEFLSGLTDKNLQKYTRKFFKSSVEEWVLVFAKYQKHGRMVNLLLRLPKESSEFNSIATVMLSKPVLDRVILSTAPEILEKLLSMLPKSLPRMRELFVQDENFRIDVLKQPSLVELLLEGLPLEQAVELDIKGVRKVDYDTVVDELEELSPNMLRRWFSSLFRRGDKSVQHFLSENIVTIMLGHAVDRSDYAVLPLLVRALGKYRRQIDIEAATELVEGKIGSPDFEFALLDVDPNVLASLPQLPAKGDEACRLREAFYRSDMLLMRMFLETDDSKLAMLLLRDTQLTLVEWLAKKFRVVSAHAAADVDVRPLEKLTARFVVSAYGSSKKNTSLLGCLMQQLQLRQLPRFLSNQDLCDRFVMQLAHTVGSSGSKYSLLVAILTKKIKSKDNMASYIKIFQSLNSAFSRLAPTNKTKSFYRAWTAFLELSLVKIIQFKIDKKGISDVADNLLNAHNWRSYKDRAILVGADQNINDQNFTLQFPCPQLYFLFEMMCTPQQLLREFAEKKVGNYVCAEFLCCVDEEEGVIQLSGDVKLRWLSCYEDFTNAASRFAILHKSKGEVNDADFKKVTRAVFGKSRISSRDLSYDIVECKPGAETDKSVSSEEDSRASSWSDLSSESEEEEDRRKCILM